MEIANCLRSDTTAIMSLYESARQLQIQRKMVVWPTFGQSFIEQEIAEWRQWKIMIGDAIACNWAVTYEDRAIWGDKDQGDSVFIHRICTNPTLRGNRYIEEIVAWTKLHASETGKRFVRLDTLGNNTKLIKHYTSAGFDFLGIFVLSDTSSLPRHYQEEPNCCLFEIDLEK